MLALNLNSNYLSENATEKAVQGEAEVTNIEIAEQLNLIEKLEFRVVELSEVEKKNFTAAKKGEQPSAVAVISRQEEKRYCTDSNTNNSSNTNTDSNILQTEISFFSEQEDNTFYAYDWRKTKEKPHICILMCDTRYLSSNQEQIIILTPEKIDKLFHSNHKYYAFTSSVNKLYSDEHGYELFTERPEEGRHYPDRKVLFFNYM